MTRHVDGQTYQLSLTDTAGQEEYRGLWAASNLKSADAFLLVYDITKADSLAGLDRFVELIEMESEHRLEFAQDGLAGRAGAASARGGYPGAVAAAVAAAGTGAATYKMPPVKIIAGNKCDLARVRQVRSAQGLEYARSHGCGFMETSAKNMVNIEETFARKSLSTATYLADASKRLTSFRCRLCSRRIGLAKTTLNSLPLSVALSLPLHGYRPLIATCTSPITCGAVIVRRVIIERRRQYHSGQSPTFVSGAGGSSPNSEGGGNQSTKAAGTTTHDEISTPALSTSYHLSEKERQRQQAQSFDQGLDDKDRQGGKGGGSFWQRLRCW